MSASPAISWWPLSLPGCWLYKWQNISSGGGFQNEVLVLAIGGVQHRERSCDWLLKWGCFLVRCLSFVKNDQARLVFDVPNIDSWPCLCFIESKHFVLTHFDELVPVPCSYLSYSDITANSRVKAQVACIIWLGSHTCDSYKCFVIAVSSERVITEEWTCRHIWTSTYFLRHVCLAVRFLYILLLECIWLLPEFWFHSIRMHVGAENPPGVFSQLRHCSTKQAPRERRGAGRGEAEDNDNKGL